MGVLSRFGGSIVAGVVLLGSLTGSAHAVPCRNATTTVDTFYIETEWNKTVYRPGETVKVTVTVSRPNEEDPLGNGIPLPITERMPAQDVQVTTAFAINPPYWPYGGDITDAAGQVHLKIKLPKSYVGKVQTTTMAKKVTNANGPACTEITEQSTKFEEPFEVKRGS